MTMTERKPRGIDPAFDYLSRPPYYDRRGKPITMDEWCDLSAEVDYRRIGSAYMEGATIDGERVPGTLWVSTVWLGLDHSFARGAPLIFETMVFWQADTGEETGCMRYTTEEQAVEGHRRTVESLEQGRQPFAWVNDEA